MKSLESVFKSAPIEFGKLMEEMRLFSKRL